MKKIFKTSFVGLIALNSLLNTNVSNLYATKIIHGSAFGNDPYYPTFGNGGYDVKKYKIDLNYNPKTHFLNSVANLKILANANLATFNLDLLGFKVTKVLVNGATANFSRSGAHELVIKPSNFLPKNKIFETKIYYHGIPNPQKDSQNSVGWQYSSSGGAFAAGQPNAALTWFPVNEMVTDKALFEVTATVPKDFNVISNGLKTQEKVNKNLRTVTWKTTNPLASYLTTIGIDKWTFLNQQLGKIPLVSAFAPGQTNKISLEKQLPQVLRLLQNYYGQYPLEAGGGIFIADKINFSLETQTRPIYASWTDMDTIVHENAHQWWGDSVSVRNWKDICMNECMASYSSYLWDSAKEQLDLDNWYSKSVLLRRFNVGFWSNKLYDMGAGKEFSMNGVYSKGPLFIHALRKEVGDKIFWNALKQFQVKYHNSNASMLDFFNLFNSNSSKDLTEFFKEWLGDTRPQDKYLYPDNLPKNFIPKDLNKSDIEGSLQGLVNS